MLADFHSRGKAHLVMDLLNTKERGGAINGAQVLKFE